MKKTDYYLKLFALIASGILLISSIFPFLINHYFNNWSTSGTFGDTFGALNAVFSGIAISGLIITILIQRKELEHQREELGLQRNEMQETRREFSVTRITNIIYHQLERYENALKEFKIISDNNYIQGYEAMFFLDSNTVSTSFPFDDRSPEEILEERKRLNCQAMTLYSNNNKSIAQFSLSAYNSMQVVKEVLLSSNLTIDEMNRLKNLYFRNIGFIHMRVIEDISSKFHEYLELSNLDNDFIHNCEVEFGKLARADIFLKAIVEFRETIITIEFIEDIKTKWKSEFGAFA